jgi:hypothetical protein
MVAVMGLEIITCLVYQMGGLDGKCATPRQFVAISAHRPVDHESRLGPEETNWLD